MWNILPSLLPFVESFCWLFTAPSYVTHTAILLGWIMCLGSRTLFRAFLSASPSKLHDYAGPHGLDTSYNFFERSGWNPSDLFYQLAHLVFTRLSPSGKIKLVVDDTLFHKRGIHVWGKGWFRDAVASTKKRVATAPGHNWVVLAVLFEVPCLPIVLALPIMARLHRAEEGTLSCAQLAREMVSDLMKHFPNRSFLLMGDGGYSNKEMLEGLDGLGTRIDYIGRIRADSALYDPTVPEQPKSKPGAKPQKGPQLPTPKEVAQQAEFIFYCVGNTAMARSVALGKDGLLEGIRPGSVTADCSTISPSESVEIGQAFAAHGAHFLDAPCTGSRTGSENAALTFMVGGDQGAVERARPYFEVMGKRLYYCGPSGQGLRAKLTQNLVLANVMQAFSEGLVLAAKNGVAPELMIEILDNSAAKSGLLSAKAPSILKRDFRTHFSTKWMLKDVGLALASAEAMDLPLPLTAITQQMLLVAIAKGYGEDDFCSAIRVLEELGGVEVRGLGHSV